MEKDKDTKKKSKTSNAVSYFQFLRENPSGLKSDIMKFNLKADGYVTAISAVGLFAPTLLPIFEEIACTVKSCVLGKEIPSKIELFAPNVIILVVIPILMCFLCFVFTILFDYFVYKRDRNL